jgi:hypothetical protein
VENSSQWLNLLNDLFADFTPPLLGLFLLSFFLCSCVTARRRRRAGQNPYYGTGWAARNQTPHDVQPYYANNNQYPPPPPEYSPDVPNGHQQYYGAPQQTGIELQAPTNVYTPGRSTDVYEPPIGAPQKKGDGMIR